jgi:hypothetical protein
MKTHLLIEKLPEMHFEIGDDLSIVRYSPKQNDKYKEIGTGEVLKIQDDKVIIKFSTLNNHDHITTSDKILCK